MTIFGHFKGKRPKKIFRRLCKGKIQVFQAPTGYSTADKAFIADLCDNIWDILRGKADFFFSFLFREELKVELVKS